MSPLPLEKRAGWAMWLMKAAAIASLVSILPLMFDIETGALYFLPSVVIGYEVLLLVFWIPTITLVTFYLAANIVFFMWTYRAFARTPAVIGQTPEVSPGWAVGWYFVPIALYFKPYQALRDLWSMWLAVNPDDGSDVPSLFGWWWATSAFSILGGTVSWRLDDMLYGTPDYWKLALFDISMAILGAASLWLTARVVAEVTELQAQQSAAEIFA